MTRHSLLAASLLLVFGLACLCSGGGGTGADTGDTEADTDTDTDTDADTDEIPVMEEADPFLEVQFSDGSAYQPDPGYWSVNAPAGESTLTGATDGGQTDIKITVDGDLSANQADHPVDRVVYAQGVVSSWNFRYLGSGGTAVFHLEGRTEDGDHIWGSLSGTMTLTDQVGGGTLVLDGLVVDSWPAF